ncbi:MAG: hypothetical protein ABIH49_02825 [archaeon]
MRKILSKRDGEKDTRRKQLFLGFFLIFIMFFSVVGYSFQGTVSEQEDEKQVASYNGFNFAEQNGFWILEKDGRNFIFSNNPNEVSRINAELDSLDNYEGKILHIYSEDAKSESEISVNLIQITDSIQSVDSESEINCQENSIIIKESESSEIKQEGKCVFIQGRKDELVDISDEFLFKILGIA